PDYAAPEQLADAAQCDHRADLYSCGVVFFEMLAGHPRFDREHLSDQLPGIPRGVLDVIKKALCENPADRYQSASAILEALRPFFSSSVVETSELAALCANSTCSAAYRSPRGYFFGPRLEETVEKFCDACGKAYLRRCQLCCTPLSDNTRTRVLK